MKNKWLIYEYIKGNRDLDNDGLNSMNKKDLIDGFKEFVSRMKIEYPSLIINSTYISDVSLNKNPKHVLIALIKQSRKSYKRIKSMK